MPKLSRRRTTSLHFCCPHLIYISLFNTLYVLLTLFPQCPAPHLLLLSSSHSSFSLLCISSTSCIVVIIITSISSLCLSCASTIFCPSSHHQSPSFTFLLLVFCPHLLHPFVLSCLCLIHIHTSSKPFPCFAMPFLVATRWTGADYTDLNFKRFIALVYRLLGPFWALFLNENTEGT